MQKKIITILVCTLFFTSSIIIVVADNKNDSSTINLDAPDDFNLDAYCGGLAFWEELYRVQIDSEGHGNYSICYAEDRNTSDYTEIDQFDLTQNELNQLWEEIVDNGFFNLNEIYSEEDLFTDSNILISGGTFANIIIHANGEQHMVETRHVDITEFDNIMIAINSLTPGDNDLFYNGLFNIQPYTPAPPSGPTSGNFRNEHTYTTSTFDMDLDDLYYRFDWGDGEISDWIGPFESLENATASHKWNSKGDYEIKAQAKDDPNGDGDLSDGTESEWSEPSVVSMPKVIISNSIFLILLQRIFSNLPILNFFRDFIKQERTILSFQISTPTPPTEIKLDEEKCEITITIHIKIWGEGASDTLASQMETAIENLLNKDKNGNPWKLKCPKEDCVREEPGCSVKIDLDIKNAGKHPPKTGEGYHTYYVAPKQSGLKASPAGKRFVSYTMTVNINKNDNLLDYPRPNDATTNNPATGDTHIIHNGGTVGCLHADDTVGTWAHEFLHCLGLDDKYTYTWDDKDHDNVRDANEVKPTPKQGHKDDIMANATKWLQQWAINLTMGRINLKCPCKCCPAQNDTTEPETKIENPNNGEQVSNPIVVGGYADDGAGGSGIVLLDYALEWDSGNYDGSDYPIDPPERYVQFELGPINLDNYIDPGDWISITVFATDDEGNTGSDTVTVTWEEQGDTTPPITDKIVGQPSEQDGYIIWPHTPITFESTDDNSGVNHISYEVWWDSNDDGIVDMLMGSETVYDHTLTFSVNMWGVLFGYMALKWHAVDNAGNVEDIHYQEHFVNP